LNVKQGSTWLDRGRRLEGGPSLFFHGAQFGRIQIFVFPMAAKIKEGHDAKLRHGVRRAEQDSKPPAVNTDTKVTQEEEKLLAEDTKPAEEVLKVPAPKEAKPAEEVPKAPTPEAAMLAAPLAQVAALAAQIPNLPANQNATAQLAAIAAQLPKLPDDQNDIPALKEKESESGVPKENSGANETAVTEEENSGAEETAVTEEEDVKVNSDNFPPPLRLPLPDFPTKLILA